MQMRLACFVSTTDLTRRKSMEWFYPLNSTNSKLSAEAAGCLPPVRYANEIGFRHDLSSFWPVRCDVFLNNNYCLLRMIESNA